MNIKFLKLHQQSGFTLIEISVVLLVVAILIGYTVALVPVQIEVQEYRSAKSEMKQIQQALYAFAQANGRLPCADSVAAPDGNEDGGGASNCTTYEGLLPGRTLALNGKYDSNGSFLDPWGQPYLYQVSDDDSDGNGADDFVRTDEIQAVGMSVVAPDLNVCEGTTTNAGDNTCNGTITLAGNVPAVVLSTGKDRAQISSGVQDENLDGDKVYVMQSRSDVSGSEYDDLLLWLPANMLYSKMIDAERLP